VENGDGLITGMLRLRACIVLLLPVVWLAMAIPCSWEPYEAMHGEFSSTASSPADSDWECGCQIDSARCPWRRSVSEELEAGLRSKRIFSVVEPTPKIKSGSENWLKETDVILPQSWQFLWRTAAPPREPSEII
jgi:hypothetical protein